jgi:lipoprotein-releasing system ATP-binding protein
VLLVDSVCKSYVLGEAPVLDGVSLRLEAGTLAALVGPSGSGKSTLLNLIGLLDEADSGQIFVDDRLVSASTLPTRLAFAMN